MALSFLYRMVRGVVELARLHRMDDAAKDAEILVLRHQLAVLRRQVTRPHYNDHRPHRSLAPACPRSPEKVPTALADNDPTRVRGAERLGGLIHEYRMAA